MNIFQRYKNVYIHRAKLAFICTQLQPFHRSISSRTFPNVPAQPADADRLRQLIQLVGGLRQLFQSLDQNNAINTLIQAPIHYVKDYLNNFRTNFGNIVVALRLAPESPCPMNPTQERVDDFADCKELYERLTAYMSSATLRIDARATLGDRLDELRGIIQQYENERAQTDDQERNKTLSPEEINTRMQKMRPWRQNQNDFDLQKKIGSGGFADVFLGYQRSTRKMVAVKKLHNEEFTEQTYEMFRREVEIFAVLDHYALLPFVGVCLTAPFYIVTEYMSGGCLFTRLHQKSGAGKLDPTKRTIIALGVAYGMKYLHDRNMVHRDLKSLNVLLDADDYPKVCDFGMSREIASVMTGMAGTPQWMAPEVLNGQPYDTAADVYSYGVLLWEILTCEIPFRGLRDVQIAMAVVANSKRPNIPQDCPPKLEKFIKMCWDQDPKKRLNFGDITRALESGEVTFPGTNMNAVRAYITRFNKTATQNVEEVKEVQPKVATIDDYVEKLLTVEAPSALSFLRKSMADEKWVKQAVDCQKFMPNLMKACDACNSSLMASDIIGIFTILAGVDKFLGPLHVQKAFQVFCNFGTTQMKEIIAFIMKTLPLLKQIKLTQQQLFKIAAFMQSSDIATRVEMTVTFKSMIEFEVYDKVESLRNAFSYVISNCGADTVAELLEPSLDVVILLMKLEQARDSFVTYNGLTAIISIFNANKGSQINEKAIKILADVVTTILLPEEAIKECVRSLMSVVKALKGDVLARFLAAFAGLLGFKATYRAFAEEKEGPEALSACFAADSPAAVLIALKICYALLMKNKSHKAIAEIAPSFVPLLSNPVDAIVNVAAACLVSAIPECITLEEVMNAHLVAFFNKALASQNDLSVYALRLCGAISNNLSGAKFLETNGVIKKMTPFLSSTDAVIQKLAMMTYAAFSSAYPMSGSAVAVVPVFMEAMTHQQHHPYPLIFLSNVVMHPDGASQCAASLGSFAALLRSGNDDTVPAVLTAVMRMVSCPEALLNCKNAEPIGEIYKAAEAHMDDELFLSYVDIVAALSGTPSGKSALTTSRLPKLLEKKLQLLPKNDMNRPNIMRVLARCGCF